MTLDSGTLLKSTPEIGTMSNEDIHAMSWEDIHENGIGCKGGNTMKPRPVENEYLAKAIELEQRLERLLKADEEHKKELIYVSKKGGAAGLEGAPMLVVSPKVNARASSKAWTMYMCKSHATAMLF